MGRRFVECCLVISALSVTGGLSIAQERDAGRTKAVAEALPRIVISLRDDLQTVKKRSSFDLSETSFMDVGGIIEAEAELEYVDPRLKFEIPIVKYTKVSRYVGRPGRDGQIYSVGFAPHRGTLRVDEAWDLFLALSEKFDKAGWQRDSDYPRSHFAEKPYQEFEALLRSNRFEIGARKNVGFWRSDADRLWVSVVKVFQFDKDNTSAAVRDDPRFNLIVDIGERAP